MTATPKDVEYARNRYSTMSFKQLRTRLGRMTKPEKLEAFAVVVEEDLMRLVSIGDIPAAQVQMSEQFCLLAAINDKRSVPTVIIPPPSEPTHLQAVIRKPPVSVKVLGVVVEGSEPKRKIPRRRISME
tara:strand:+ start:213 stop:599 length:387 start_codon:yes stop_codon:yes gene_type:complete